METVGSKLTKPVKAVLISAFVCLVLFFTGALIMRFDTGGGVHTYAQFGNGRFEISIDGYDGTKFLNDDWVVYVARVERYLEKGDLLFVTGYHSFTGADPNNPHPPYYGFVTGSHNIDDASRYNSVDKIPRYIILNFKTAEMKLYRTLDEVPENQRQYFTQKLNWWCDLMRSCYETK